MNRFLWLLTAVACVWMGSCKPEDEARPCNYLPAGAGMEFRIEDSAGKDRLYGRQDTLIITQPCRTSPLMPDFKAYPIPGTTDSGIVISFADLRTPAYGEGGNCFRILFDWNNGDVDTVDWHYRIEESGGCALQVIDYMSYNGIQAKKKTDYAHEYYQLIKR